MLTRDSQGQLVLLHQLHVCVNDLLLLFQREVKNLHLKLNEVLVILELNGLSLVDLHEVSDQLVDPLLERDLVLLSVLNHHVVLQSYLLDLFQRFFFVFFEGLGEVPLGFDLTVELLESLSLIDKLFFEQTVVVILEDKLLLVVIQVNSKTVKTESLVQQTSLLLYDFLSAFRHLPLALHLLEDAEFALLDTSLGIKLSTGEVRLHDFLHHDVVALSRYNFFKPDYFILHPFEIVVHLLDLTLHLAELSGQDAVFLFVGLFALQQLVHEQLLGYFLSVLLRMTQLDFLSSFQRVHFVFGCLDLLPKGLLTSVFVLVAELVELLLLGVVLFGD